METASLSADAGSLLVRALGKPNVGSRPHLQ